MLPPVLSLWLSCCGDRAGHSSWLCLPVLWPSPLTLMLCEESKCCLLARLAPAYSCRLILFCRKKLLSGCALVALPEAFVVVAP